MNSSRTAVVDVGTPPSKFHDNGWTTTEVRYHGFAGLTTVRGQPVISSEFACLGHQWHLDLYPGGALNSDEGKVGVYLENMSEESVEIKYGFSTRESEGRDAPIEQVNRWAKKLFHPYGHHNAEEGTICCWGRDFAKRSDLLGNLVEGALVVEVRMRRTGSNHPSQPFIAENPLCNMILKMFMDEESADVVFEVEAGDQQVRLTRKRTHSSVTTFHAHRLILKQCAPMLAELCGSRLTSVPITGVRPEVFRHMLYYVYGGNVAAEDLKSHAKKIIDAADRFSVVNLKLEAEACYVKSTAISADNMMELLLYADSMNCALLKETVMDYIVQNDVEVLKKVSLKDAPGGLLADLLTAVARGKKQGAGAGEGDQSGDELSTMRISDLRRKLHEKGLDIDGSRETLIASLEENA